MRIFQKFQKLKKKLTQIFVILSIYKPSLGSFVVPYKIWALSVELLLRLLDTNGQTPRQAKCIY